MPELNERTKTTLGAAALVMLGALSAQGWTIIQLAGKASVESVEKLEAQSEERYVRKDVLAESMDGIRAQLEAMRQESLALRGEVTTLRVEVAGLRSKLDLK